MFIAVLYGSLLCVSAQETAIRIVYVSKMPEIDAGETGAGGLAELASLVRQTRAASANTLFLHGGDSLGPSAMSIFDHGTHMVEILDEIRPDMMAVNEREFTYKEDELILRAGEASFPFVCSNILDPLEGGNLPGVRDEILFERGGFRIGVFALIDPQVTETYLPDRIRIREQAETIDYSASFLRAQGADIVILLSGYKLENSAALLASGTLDIIFESTSAEDAILTQGRGFLARQGTAAGKAVMVDLFLERKGGSVRSRTAGKLVPLAGYPPDRTVAGRIAGYLATLSSFMNVRVGVTETALDTTKAAVRTSETAFGNLVADALRAHYGADIAFVNSGSIRGNKVYPAGTTLTRRDIQGELPFMNQSKFVTVTGAQIVAAFENSFSQIEEVKGRYLQISGLTVAYCPDEPVGSRVRSVLVRGRPLKTDQTYTLATLDYLVQGGDGFDMLKTSTAVRTPKSSFVLWEIVRQYIEQQKGTRSRIEGRLIVNCK